MTVGHPEQDLIQKAKAGDNLAYEDLLRPNLAPAARLAHTLLGNPDEAEDAVQEAAVKGWRKLGNLRAGAPFQPWFLGIVVRQVRTIQRAPWWTLIRLTEVPVQSAPAIETWMDGEELRLAIGNLPRLQREADFRSQGADPPHPSTFLWPARTGPAPRAAGSTSTMGHAGWFGPGGPRCRGTTAETARRLAGCRACANPSLPLPAPRLQPRRDCRATCARAVRPAPSSGEVGLRRPSCLQP